MVEPAKSTFQRVMNETVAATIARERATRRWTIDRLARDAGVSAGLLSQLEREIGNPSLRTIHDVAAALELPISAFFATGDFDAEPVVHPATRKRLVFTQELSYELLVPDLLGTIAMFRVELPAGFSNADAPFSHVGEEVELVLEGSVRAYVGENAYTLEAGDSIRHLSGVAHWFETFEERCVMIWAQSPPSF